MPPPSADKSPPSQPWWLRIAATLPLGAWYFIARLLALLATAIGYRRHVAQPSLELAFPEIGPAGIRRILRDYYWGYAQVLVETVKAASLSREQLAARVSVAGLEPLRDCVARGRPAIVLAAHQANWEWLLFGLCVHAGVAVDAAYKPLVNPWAEHAMFAVRSRFGARMVPAQDLLGDILQRRKLPRIIAINADQEPVQSDNKHWLRFLNRDSAFFTGPEEIARATRYPVWFMRIRRVGLGRYAVEAVPLWDGAEKLAPGEFTERYARMAEDQIRAAPADWLWSHKRWKLRRGLYA